MHTINMQNNSINKPDSVLLTNLLPDGQVVNRKWFKTKGFNRMVVDYFVRSGKLERVGHGVYRRPGPPLKWEHVVYSLQEMGSPVHVGGRSALDLQGMAHYLHMGDMQTVELYGVNKLPDWLSALQLSVKLVARGMGAIYKLPSDAITTRPFGHWDWQLRFSTVELALFELLGKVKDESGFSLADKYFESASTLRPKLLNKLLRSCRQIKTKRLFLWFSDRHSHAWRSKLNTGNVDLGSGKRMIIKGGALDKTYSITVPRSMIGEQGAENIF
ncbi:MAG: type IV toxin-antitoxin system AbiEi family antitoxin domain-containing protein [Candidatus Hodarchaeales archaeon]|jgi:hypothetical protein